MSAYAKGDAVRLLRAIDVEQAHRLCAPASQRVCLSRGTEAPANNMCSLVPKDPNAHHSIAVFLTTFFANFVELRYGEVRRTSLSGTSVHRAGAGARG